MDAVTRCRARTGRAGTPPIPSAALHGGTFAASWRWCAPCTTI